MTQNTHSVRTRREQLAAYPESVSVGRYSGDTWQLELDGDDLDADRLVEGPVLYVRCDIAHRNQTEAEGQEPAAWQWLDAKSGWLQIIHDDPATHAQEMEEMGIACRPVYLGPANVAALEAEIESLKMTQAHSDGVRNEKQKCINALEAVVRDYQKVIRHIVWTASEYGLGRIGHESAVDKARAALTREGGV